MNESAQQQQHSIDLHSTLGEMICSEMSREVTKLGFDEKEIPDIDWHDMEFTITHDPADGAECLNGNWTNEHGHRLGGIVFNGDGSFFAEFDVVKPHPTDKRWFVEAVTAWGNHGQITTEPKLLMAV